MNGSIDLSIIIVTWKSLEFTRACLASIYSTISGLTFEIIVVDNASGDDSERVIVDSFPNVIFIATKQNLGFAKANNLGFSYSSGQTILFLNPDTEVRDNVFARMVEALRSNSTAGAVGARLVNSDGSLQASCVQAYPTIWNQLVDCNILRRMFPNWSGWGMSALFRVGNVPSAVEAISGAGFMLRRDVFAQVGGFTESYLMYVEDLDLSYKIGKAGYRILYLPDCQIIHHGGKSSAQQTPYFVNLQQKAGIAHFFLSTHGWAHYFSYRASISLIALTRLALVASLVLLNPLTPRKLNGRLLVGKWFAVFRWAIGQGPAFATKGKGMSVSDLPEKAI